MICIPDAVRSKEMLMFESTFPPSQRLDLFVVSVVATEPIKTSRGPEP